MSLSFKEYLFENTLSGPKFSKYKDAVISKLNSGENIRLGDKGKSGEFNKSDLTDDQLTALSKANTPKEFNDAFPETLKKNGVKWTNIFKGDFSGYSDGFSSGNKGSEFEDWFFGIIKDGISGKSKENKIYETLLNQIGVEKLYGVEHSGGNNTKRPIKFENNEIKIGKGFEDIGDVISDITAYAGENKTKPIYLSLKYGGTTSFMNIGIKSLFPNEFFEKEDEGLSDDASALLKTLNIDPKLFKETFKNYGSEKPVSESVKIEKDVLSKNKGLKDIIAQAIGYGYIIVHKKGSVIHYRDLRTIDKVNEYISNEIKSAVVYYGGLTGGGKRVDVVVELPLVSFKFNIRSKNGSTYPTHLNADYKFAN